MVSAMIMQSSFFMDVSLQFFYRTPRGGYARITAGQAALCNTSGLQFTQNGSQTYVDVES